MTKVTFLVKAQNVSVLMSMEFEYHDVLPNISLSWMSVYALYMAWKKSTLGKMQKHQYM